MDADLPADFYSSWVSVDLVRKLADQALRGAHEFTVRPVLPLYLPGEPVELEVRWKPANSAGATVAISISPGDFSSESNSIAKPLPITEPLMYPAPKEKGAAHHYCQAHSRRQSSRNLPFRLLDSRPGLSSLRP